MGLVLITLGFETLGPNFCSSLVTEAQYGVSESCTKVVVVVVVGLVYFHRRSSPV